jgi:SAM-dependent methyltransferase
VRHQLGDADIRGIFQLTIVSIEELMARVVAPPPSTDLIRYVVGIDDYGEFLRSGAEVFTMFDLAARRYGGKSMSEFNKILDFGCGIGRILQFIPEGPSVCGCDVNQWVSEYTKRTHRRAEIYCNSLMPPLKYPAGTFDLIYSFSVFSHLSLAVERAWLEELERIGATECLYLVTIHGDWVIEATLGDEREKAEREGFYYRRGNQRNGSEFDFPDYYETSYHTSQYIRTNWRKNFDVVSVVKGDDPSRYLYGNLKFAPAGSIPRLRPMGQDLVVMRKRSPS